MGVGCSFGFVGALRCCCSGPLGEFVRLFFRTFNLELYPDNPLDWLPDQALADALESTGATVGHSLDPVTPAPEEERPHV